MNTLKSKIKVNYLAYDLIIVNLALYLSLLIKFDRKIPNDIILKLPYNFITTTLASGIIFYLYGLYSMLWVYASLEELIKIFLATSLGICVQIIATCMLGIMLPLTASFICWILTFNLVGVVRLSTRLLKQIKIKSLQTNSKKRVMIIGAGEAASILIKEIKNNVQSIYDPVVAIDDDCAKHNTHINGIPIIGGRDSIVTVARDMSIHMIIIAIPSLSRRKIAELIKICRETNCKIKVLPSVYSLVNGDISFNKIRDVTLEDLLTRDEIDLAMDEIALYIYGKTILVTGGGGSIGSELCRQIADFLPKKLLIFDIYENNAYDLQNELQQKYKDKLDITVIIGSIQDRNKLESIFSLYKPQIVFHAAAHKHVPLMEDNPQEAVKNNIFGTLNLAEYAHEYNTETFVLISTDKAVNPTSIMGATKRAAELIIQHKNKSSKTKYCAVRFGNVLGSSGSIIPLFKKQIQYGGPITITHPEITRYFMTIPEAVSLVIQSGAMMEGGEIFVLDMGEPINITDLAISLITLSGLKPHIDIEIQYIGLRPGEKLYEELLITEGDVKITKNNKIFIEKGNQHDITACIKILEEERPYNLENQEEVIEFLEKLIPSYQSNRNK